jgi:osmotically-inducible protein OsmY
MKAITVKKTTRWLAAAVAGLCLATVVPQAAGAASSDAWVTAKAKIALMTTEDVHGTAINVDTVDGRVTLHGKVRSEAEKATAGAVVAKIDGAREVRNLLQVVSARATAAINASDDQIKRHVVKAFQADRRLAGSGISVQSVNKGVVLLGGETSSMTTHLRAITTAAGVPGVQRVATEVKGPDTLADAELGQKASPHAGRMASSLGDTATDMWITSATKLRLLAKSDTPALDINVDTTNGRVTLFGIVPSQKAKRAAGVEASKVSGVKSVSNELQVVASAYQKSVKANDADVKSAVEQALERRQDVTGKDISVQVKDGVARLTGTVPNEEARVTAATVVRATPGVRAVLWEALEISQAR